MDFVEGFPWVGGKSVILSHGLLLHAGAVDRLEPPLLRLLCCPFLLRQHMRLHDIHCSIVSDHDPVFTNNF